MLRKPTFGNKIAYLTLLLVEKTLSLFPVAAVWHMGALLGQIFHILSTKRRNIVLSNLSIAKPDLNELERENLAKKVFRYSFGNLLSSSKTGTMPVTKLKEHVTLGNLEAIKSLPKDKGCIFMIFHMGNWEILTRVHDLIGLEKPTGSIFQTLKNPLVDKHIRESREKEGTKLFAKKRGLIEATKFLKNGGALGILCDQYAGRKGISLSLFNKKTFVTPLPATMAQKYDCPIIPVIITTEQAGHWKLSFGEAIKIPKELDKNEATLALAPIMESIMRENIQDIFWLHDRWKNKHASLHNKA